MSGPSGLGCDPTAVVRYYAAMYAGVNLAAAGSAAFAVLAALPAFAAPGDSQKALEQKVLEGRWVPALAVKSGVLFQQQDSSSESVCIFGGRGDGDENENCSFFSPGPFFDLREPQSGDTWAVTPYVGANIQLMSPALTLIPGRPRIFVSGEMLANFAASRDIASEGDPSKLKAPTGADGNPLPPERFPAKSYLGDGSRTTSQVQTLSWGADLGLAFPLRFQGRQLRIKPSAGWMRFGMDVDGLVVAGVKDDWNPPPGCNQCFGANTREIRLEADASKIFNAIGPGLEVELEAGRFGSVAASLFLGAHVYWVLGDRSVTLSDSIILGRAEDPGGVDGLRPDVYIADWSFEMDRMLYRAGLGIRFHWLGR